MDRQIHVSRPFFPPLGEYEIYLEQIWKSGIVTHNGPMVQDLEKKLKELLKVRHIACVSNGTLAIQLAIKALNLQGEIITTPFTFIATISSVIWEKCKPVFVDINPYTLNIDENKIEEKITDNTVGILGVHVFSNPCNTDRIDEIAKKYHLKVIYDAAHAMHVEYKGKSIFEYGDISTTSFHGTKIFNTIEGGACFSNDATLDRKIRELRFFGQDVNKEIVNEGTNAKMNELQAAMGLSILPYMEQVLEDRKKKYYFYKDRLQLSEFIKYQEIDENSYNYSYMPLIFDTEDRLLKIVKKLNYHNIFPRRYFYPSLEQVIKINGNGELSCKNSQRISNTVLCLPLYYDLEYEVIEKITNLINTTF